MMKFRKIKLLSFLLAGCLLCSPMQIHAESTVKGDCNSDNVMNDEDIVLLENYLHGRTIFSQEQFLTADMNQDNLVNIYDLCLLKRTVTKIPDTVLEVRLLVENYCQQPDYPTGCESASLYMLLHYYDVPVTMEQIVSALPKGSLPYQKNGRLYGANPEREFVGNPKDSSSYGAYQTPLAVTAANFKSGVHAKAGASLEEVFALLNQGKPVEVWFATNPEKGFSFRRSWYDEQTGEFIQWYSGEHAVVVCGYTQTTVTYCDPNTGTTRTIQLDRFRSLFDEIGGRILYFD